MRKDIASALKILTDKSDNVTRTLRNSGLIADWDDTVSKLEAYFSLTEHEGDPDRVEVEDKLIIVADLFTTLCRVGSGDKGLTNSVREWFNELKRFMDDKSIVGLVKPRVPPRVHSPADMRITVDMDMLEAGKPVLRCDYAKVSRHFARTHPSMDSLLSGLYQYCSTYHNESILTPFHIFLLGKFLEVQSPRTQGAEFAARFKLSLNDLCQRLDVGDASSDPVEAFAHLIEKAGDHDGSLTVVFMTKWNNCLRESGMRHLNLLANASSQESRDELVNTADQCYFTAAQMRLISDYQSRLDSNEPFGTRVVSPGDIHGQEGSGVDGSTATSPSLAEREGIILFCERYRQMTYYTRRVPDEVRGSYDALCQWVNSKPYTNTIFAGGRTTRWKALQSICVDGNITHLLPSDGEMSRLNMREVLTNLGSSHQGESNTGELTTGP